MALDRLHWSWVCHDFTEIFESIPTGGDSRLEWFVFFFVATRLCNVGTWPFCLGVLGFCGRHWAHSCLRCRHILGRVGKTRSRLSCPIGLECLCSDLGSRRWTFPGKTRESTGGRDHTRWVIFPESLFDPRRFLKRSSASSKTVETAKSMNADTSLLGINGTDHSREDHSQTNH